MRRKNIHKSLKKLYREIAKRIHPDLATDEKDRARRHKLMAEANRAYEDGDEARIVQLLGTFGHKTLPWPLV